MLAHARALDVGFFSDDLTWLARLDATRANPQYLLEIFRRDFTPLFHLSLLVDYLVAGPHAWLFHATSIAVHATCAFLLLRLLTTLGAPIAVAALAASTWALNMRISEAVIWPAARCHSLAALFMLAAFIVLAGRSRHRVLVATILLTLGLLAKETAIVGVVLAPLFMSADGPTASSMNERRFSHWLRAWPFVALGVAFVIFNAIAKPSLVLAHVSASDIALKIPFLILRPLGLGDAYSFTWPAFTLVMIIVVALALWLRHTMARLGFAWLLASCAIVAPLEKVSSRYLYVLAIGHALVLCGLVEHVKERLPTTSLRRMTAALALAAAAVVLVVNIVLIQREIADYARLAARYEACLAALRPLADVIHDNMNVVVVDTSGHSAIPAMIDESWENGGIVKLIPARSWAVGDLVPLADAINIYRRGESSWALAGLRSDPAETRRFVFDGRRLQALSPDHGRALSADARVFDAHLGSFAEMRAAERASGH